MITKNLKSQRLAIIFTIATVFISSPSSHCENLVETTCKQTPHYDLCVQTLKSDPSSSDADVKGLALILVNVLKVNVSSAREKIKQLLERGHLEPKQEKALRLCAEAHNIEMSSFFPKIVYSLVMGEPKLAEEGLVNIGLDARNCELRYPGGTSPLANEDQALRDLAAVATAIVRLLLKKSQR